MQTVNGNAYIFHVEILFIQLIIMCDRAGVLVVLVGMLKLEMKDECEKKKQWQLC